MRWTIAWSLGFTLLACGRSERTRDAAPAPTEDATLDLQPLALNTPPGSASPRLTRGSETLVLSWVEPHDGALRLRAAQWAHSPDTVVTDPELLQNWADLPSVVAGPAGWFAAWPQRRAEGYDLRWGQRVDGRWVRRGPVSDARDGPEFGFVSWAVDEAVTAFWLDGRASTTSHGGAMQLWSATVDTEGIAERRLVDDRVCDCCQTSAAATPRGAVVAYRDRDEHEVRDIWLAGPGPHQRRRLGQDRWRIEGCPVNGPAVVSHRDAIAVAWFSGAPSPGRVQVAFASGDEPFSEPVGVDDGAPLGRVDLVWADDGSVIVSWLERADDGAQVRLRRVTTAGARSPSAVVVQTEASRDAGFPQLERSGDTLAFAWVDLRDGSSAVAAGELSLSTTLKRLGTPRAQTHEVR